MSSILSRNSIVSSFLGGGVSTAPPAALSGSFSKRSFADQLCSRRDIGITLELVRYPDNGAGIFVQQVPQCFAFMFRYGAGRAHGSLQCCFLSRGRGWS